MIRTAREIFGTGPFRAEWEKLAQTPAFEQGCQAAVAIMVEEQPMAGTLQDGWDYHSQLAGARKLVDILGTLHQKEPEKRADKRATLNYNVK